MREKRENKRTNRPRCDYTVVVLPFFRLIIPESERVKNKIYIGIKFYKAAPRRVINHIRTHAPLRRVGRSSNPVLIFFPAI